MNDVCRYLGPDLEEFQAARNWQAYLSRMITPHIGARVLEVGAGIGTLTRAVTARVSEKAIRSWVCLEPDDMLRARITNLIAAGELPEQCAVTGGTLAGLADEEFFDSVLYIDVLEHIEDDLAEITEAARRVTPGGKIIVMAPAHDWLFSELDKAAKHFRRYNYRTLRRLTPEDCHVATLRYLDSVGMLASAANRLILHRESPSKGHIYLWDNIMVPVSRYILDPLTGYRLGKSVLLVWTKSRI